MVLRVVFAMMAIPIILFLLFKGLSAYNISQIKPTEHEISILKQNFGDIVIKSEVDIVNLQNKSFDLIAYDGRGLNHYQEIVIDSLFKWKRALCFHRSLLLQKIFLYNNINVTPVYLYFDKQKPDQTSITDLLDSDLQSHNVFLIDFQGKSYLIQTNHRMTRLLTIEEYFNISTMPKGTKYLKHLNNRNGNYISPAWIPDIY